METAKLADARLMTPDDLAARWQKPVQWIYSNWKSIGLEPIRLGKQLRFRLEDIERWEDENTYRRPTTRSSGALSFNLWKRFGHW